MLAVALPLEAAGDVLTGAGRAGRAGGAGSLEEAGGRGSGRGRQGAAGAGGRRRAEEPGELFRAHLDWVRGVAYRAVRRLPATVDIDDALQVARIELWRLAHTYRADYSRAGYAQPVPFRGYARPRIYWAVLMAYRHRAFRDAANEPLVDAAAEDRAEEAARRAEAARLLDAALEGLPELERRVVRLYYSGRTLAQAGAELGVSVFTACMAHQRALAALRVRLEAIGIRGVDDVL